MNDALLHSIVVLYLIVGAGRVVFYLPQALAIIRCPNKASSSSLLSSGYFAFSFWVSTLYFSTAQPDLWAGLISAGNGIAMTVICGLIFWKRRGNKFEDTKYEILGENDMPPFLER
jgi:hypothetical protein